LYRADQHFFVTLRIVDNVCYANKVKARVGVPM
jgi:hypothetical protein